MTEPKIEHLKDLTPDPRNARHHTSRNVGMIETALGEVGAARSIVIDENGTVLAGNATIEAAARAGIERVQVVDADGETIVAVRRTGLTDEQKAKLALYDNRTAELAEWDASLLAQLKQDTPEAVKGMWDEREWRGLMEHLGDGEPHISTQEVKEGDLQNAEKNMAISERGDGLLEVICPECAQTFYVKVDANRAYKTRIV